MNVREAAIYGSKDAVGVMCIAQTAKAKITTDRQREVELMREEESKVTGIERRRQHDNGILAEEARKRENV